MGCILHSSLWDVIAEELTEMVNTNQNAEDFTKIDFAQLRNSNLCSNSNYSLHYALLSEHSGHPGL